MERGALLLVNVFDVGRKDAGFHVRASCGEQNIVWVPVDREDGGADRLLELLRDPPVVVWIKRTNRDSPVDQGRLNTHVHRAIPFLITEGTDLAPLATANLSSNGLQRTKVAARLTRSNTSVGFQMTRPVSGSGACCHT